MALNPPPGSISNVRVRPSRTLQKPIATRPSETGFGPPNGNRDADLNGPRLARTGHRLSGIFTSSSSSPGPSARKANTTSPSSSSSVKTTPPLPVIAGVKRKPSFPTSNTNTTSSPIYPPPAPARREPSSTQRDFTSSYRSNSLKSTASRPNLSTTISAPAASNTTSNRPLSSITATSPSRIARPRAISTSATSQARTSQGQSSGPNSVTSSARTSVKSHHPISVASARDRLQHNLNSRTAPSTSTSSSLSPPSATTAPRPLKPPPSSPSRLSLRTTRFVPARINTSAGASNTNVSAGARIPVTSNSTASFSSAGASTSSMSFDSASANARKKRDSWIRGGSDTVQGMKAHDENEKQEQKLNQEDDDLKAESARDVLGSQRAAVNDSEARSESSAGPLRLDVDVLNSVWEESPITDDSSFDPGGTPVDRTAVKSGYGSVFGFDLAPRSRNDSVAVTEVGSVVDRSHTQSVSIASTLSNYSVASTSTTRTISGLETGSASPPSSPTRPTVEVNSVRSSTSRYSRQHIPTSPVGPRPPLKSPNLSTPTSPQFPSFTTDPSSTSLHLKSSSASVTELRTAASPEESSQGAISAGTATTTSTVSASTTRSRSSLPASRLISKPTSASHGTARPTSPPGSSSRPLPTRGPPASFLHLEESSTPGARGPVPAPVRVSSPELPYARSRSGSVAVEHRSAVSPTPASAPSSAFRKPPSTPNISDGLPLSPSNLYSHPIPSPNLHISSSQYTAGLPSANSIQSQASMTAVSSSLSPSSPFGRSSDRATRPTSIIHPPIPRSASPPTVNLKQLLSKPAPTGYSSASESESGQVSRSPRPVRRIEKIDEKNERERIEAVTRQRAAESDYEGAPSNRKALSAGGSRERDWERRMEWETDRRTLLKERSTSRSRPTTSQSDVESRDRTGLSSLVRSTSWSRLRDRDGERAEKDKKPRNVLKRRPTAPSPSTSPINAKEFPYSSFAPAYTGTVLPLSSTPRQVSSSGSLKPPPPGIGSRGSSPSRDEKRRSLIPPSAMLKYGPNISGAEDVGSSSSPSTTPAKEVMLAYKKQQEREKIREKERNERAIERQRERELWQKEEEDRQQRKLKGRSSPSTHNADPRNLAPPAFDTLNARASETVSHPLPIITSSGISGNTRQSQQPSNLGSAQEVSPEEEPRQPYYTVVGSNSGRALSSGEIEDSYIPSFSWSTSSLAEGISSNLGVDLGLGLPRSTQSEAGHGWQRSASVSVGKPSKTSSPFGIGKTLTRKMSGRLGATKKESLLDSVGTSSAPTTVTEERGRPSLQERRVMQKKGSGNSALRRDDGGRGLSLSIDEYARPQRIASPKNGHQDIEFQPSITPAASKSSPAMSPQASPASPTSTTGHTSGKSRIWNLMKRLSSGGLRETYHYDHGSASPSASIPPPPVPAIPKNLSAFQTGPTNSDTRAGQRTSRNTSSVTASSLPGKPSTSSSTSSRVAVTSSHIPASTGTPPSTRPGTATRSSSPLSSSDIASSKFFNRSHSQRSSSSSFGEQIPPVPSPPGKSQLLQQHIVPPSDLYRLHLNLEKNQEIPQTRNSMSAHSSASTRTAPSLTHSRSHTQLRLQTRSTTHSNEDWQIIPTPKEERPGFSLPVPQRQRKDNDSIEDAGLRRLPTAFDDRRPPSPIIPVFSNDAAVNAWSAAGNFRKSKSSTSPITPASSALSAAPFSSSSVSLSSRSTSRSHERTIPPPTIPSKSPKRALSSAGSSASSKAFSPLVPPLPPTPSTVPAGGYSRKSEDGPKNDRSAKQATRKSLGPGVASGTQIPALTRTRTASNPSRPKTLQSLRTPSSTSAFSEPSPSRPQRFTSPPQSHPAQGSRGRGNLSDKEKADKWDDLLQRSERAGGTLHLNVGMDSLASDRMLSAGNESGGDSDGP